jgi:hypothetical protein
VAQNLRLVALRLLPAELRPLLVALRSLPVALRLLPVLKEPAEWLLELRQYLTRDTPKSI